MPRTKKTDLINIPVAAAIVGVTRRIIDLAVDAGKIPVHIYYEAADGQRPLLSRSSVEQFARRRLAAKNQSKPAKRGR